MPKKKPTTKLKPAKREPKPDFSQIAWATVQKATQGKMQKVIKKSESTE
jgi:hypothetical protein